MLREGRPAIEVDAQHSRALGQHLNELTVRIRSGQRNHRQAGFFQLAKMLSKDPLQPGQVFGADGMNDNRVSGSIFDRERRPYSLLAIGVP